MGTLPREFLGTCKGLGVGGKAVVMTSEILTFY